VRTISARGGIAIGCALAALCVAALPARGAASAPGAGASWVTSADSAKRLDRGPAIVFADTPPLATVVDVDAGTRYQAWAGVGAAITDASALLLEHVLAPAARNALLAELYGPAPGIGFTLARVAIGGSDFSTRHYSLDDPPDGLPDPALGHFATELSAAPVMPVLRRLRALNPSLKVFAAPWSAPAWMKDNGSLIKGRLRADAYPAYAEYLLRFADRSAAEGVPLYAFTIQNEPGFEPPDYPGMRFDAPDRARFIATELGPRLAAHPFAPRLYDWDHNWDKPAQPLGVLDDPAAAKYVSGVAWHCYGGRIDAQGTVHELHPDKEVFITECTGGDWAPEWRGALRFYVGSLLIDGARNWSRGVILWNVMLDERHGPHLGGCRDCRGVVSVDSTTGAITRNVEYYSLAHVARFVRPGAVRIDSTSVPGALRTVAFQNIDDGSIVLVVYNDGPDATFSIRMAGRSAPYSLEAGAAATLTWIPPR
jgi:glucosylceramidase